jgi:zinc transport system permease protein
VLPRQLLPRQLLGQPFMQWAMLGGLFTDVLGGLRGILLGVNPTLVLIPFAVVALSLVETYRGDIQQLLFGDILGISWSDLPVIALLLLGAFGVGASRDRLALLVRVRSLSPPLFRVATAEAGNNWPSVGQGAG